MFLRHSFVLLMIGLVMIACRSDRRRAPAAVADSDSATAQLSGPATRIVSLSPATTELLFAIGAGERVVGRTRWGEDPPEAMRVVSVGEGLSPNVEAVLARRPDLVVFYRSPANGSAIERLQALNIATVSVELDRLDDLGRVARLLGGLTGTAERADSLARSFEASLRSLPQLPDSAQRPGVLIVAWDSPPIVIGATSFLSEIVERAGGRNVFGDIAKPSATVSLETIAARDPDVVLLTGGSSPTFAERPEWRVIEAVRERRFVGVSGTEFSRPSFRALLAIDQMRQALVPWQR